MELKGNSEWKINFSNNPANVQLFSYIILNLHKSLNSDSYTIITSFASKLIQYT